MRLAYFTPMPPNKSGIADYNAELLPYLARGAQISVFVKHADELRLNANSPHFDIYDCDRFPVLHRAHPFDLCIYHQGNNLEHEYIYERAIETPGLLVLHDRCLHHLIAERTLGREDWEGYRDEMFYAYGRLGARTADMRAESVGSDYQQFLFPLNARVVARSLGIIAHNRFTAEALEHLNTRVEIVPHHLAPEVYALDAMDKQECRRALGIPEDAWVVVSPGFVTGPKRIPVVLAAFKRLLAYVPNAMYLIVGEDHWRRSAAPLIEQMRLRNHTRLTGYVGGMGFFRYLKSADAIVNLRYPTVGESSGTLTRALGAGLPVIVSDFAQFAEFPDDVVMKVPLGPEEENALLKRLQALAYRPELGESLGRRARAWARTEWAIEKSAAKYLFFAEQIIERRGELKKRLTPNYRLDFKAAPTIRFDHDEALDYVCGFFTDDPDATGYIQFHRKRLVRIVELIPEGEPEQRFLELSSYLQLPLLVRRYGRYGEFAVTNWWEGEPREKLMRVRHAATDEEVSFPMHNVNVERDRFPFPNGHFDVALCCELIEHLREDPMHMLAELHRVVKWGGLVILTTPNIASAFSVQEAMVGRTPNIYNLYNRKHPADRHAREYTPAEVRIALESAGFKVLRLFTENVWHETDEAFLDWLDKTDVPRGLRGDNIYAVGRKQSERIERYPHELYD
jgi:glycosyltransferase involved in cell wall biosynthesis